MSAQIEFHQKMEKGRRRSRWGISREEKGSQCGSKVKILVFTTTTNFADENVSCVITFRRSNFNQQSNKLS